MRFERPLIEGTLLRRDKRFLAEVALGSGDMVTVHCANPGSLMGCSAPGSKVLMSTVGDPKHRFKHQLEIVFAGRVPVGVHTGRPSMVVAEAVSHGQIQELAGYATLRRDVAYGRGDRIDLLLEGNGLRACYVDVQNVTLANGNIALFPDLASPNVTNRLAQYTDLVREGHRAMMFFVAQRSDVERFRPADHIDSEFGQGLRDAIARGVEVVCYRSTITRRSIDLDIRLPVDLGD